MQEKFDAKIVMGKSGTRVAWNKSYSPYGYRLSEVASAMGKEIRRSNDEMTAFWSYQMMISGKEAEEFMWKWLRVFSIEDCGLANSMALIVVNNAREVYYSLPDQSGERFLAGIHAAVYLARSKKTRYTNELFLDLKDRLHKGELKPKIPDYALDFHLPHARAMGRDLYHYLTKASTSANEDHSFPKRYRERLIARAKKEK